MSAAAELVPAQALRVLVQATEPAQRAALRELVIDTGHQPVDSTFAADVVLSDGDYAAGGGLPVVALGGEDTDQAGLLARDATASQIHAALVAAAAGLTVRSAAGGFAPLPEPVGQVLFTPREIEVLDAIGNGLSNKMIARRLDISPHTVKFHVESLLRKLGARTRAEAVAKAREHRLSNTVEL